MPNTAITDSATKRYLLGTLAEEEKARLEEEYFADDTKFEELELAEGELIDAFVHEQLSAEDKRQFQAGLLRLPRIGERVRFARALAQRVSEYSPPPPKVQPVLNSTEPAPKKVPWWERLFGSRSNFQLAFAACAALILVGGLVLVTGWLRLRDESSRLAGERAELERQREELNRSLGEQQNRVNQLATEVQQMREEQAEDIKVIQDLERKLKETADPQLSVRSFATIFLMPSTLRSGGRQRELTISSETKTVRIQLALERNDYPAYNAVIGTADQSEIIRKNSLKAHKTGSWQVLLLSVPAQRLLPGDYTVEIEGVMGAQAEGVASYGFRVKRPI